MAKRILEFRREHERSRAQRDASSSSLWERADAEGQTRVSRRGPWATLGRVGLLRRVGGLVRAWDPEALERVIANLGEAAQRLAEAGEPDTPQPDSEPQSAALRGLATGAVTGGRACQWRGGQAEPGVGPGRQTRDLDRVRPADGNRAWQRRASRLGSTSGGLIRTDRTEHRGGVSAKRSCAGSPGQQTWRASDQARSTSL